LWFVTAALGVLDMLAIRRLILELYALLRLSFWGRDAVDKVGILIFSIAWVILVYVCEAYYRNLAATGLRRLLRSFALITGVQAALIALVYLTIILGLVAPSLGCLTQPAVIQSNQGGSSCGCSLACQPAVGS
jgi:hypothetical protein